MTDPPLPPSRRGPGTQAIHGSETEREPGAPVVPPVVQSSTFFWGTPSDGELRYTRYGNNPNQVALGRKIAELEGMEAAVALGSGMAATAMTVLALARAGDHVVASTRLYGATRALLGEELPHRGIETTFVDPGEGRGWREALRPTTRLVYLEIPANPTLAVLDPRPLAKLCEARGISLVCDATFASPVNFRGGDHGVDVVIHSATKYLGGHSDLIAGVVAGPRGLVDEVTRMARLYGPNLDPHAAWLLDRGLRTLEVRMLRHNRNAMALAEWFREQPGVEAVVYPGLEEHPDHRVAREIMKGYGGMLGIVLEGGGAAADRFMGALEIAMAAPSLGGVETLVSQPRHTSHAGLGAEELRRQGIAPGYVRISVGLENLQDLEADFGQALEAAAEA